MRWIPLSGVLLLLAGCATTSPGPEFDQVADAVEQRAGARPHWYRGEEADAAATARVRELIGKELDVETMTRIALLNNRRLQATFEDLGIGKAELVQAGLLPNPTLSGGVGIPNEPPSGLQLTAGFALDLLDALLIPERVHLADLELQATRHEVTEQVLALVADVRRHAYELKASMQTMEVLALIEEASASAAELARRQHAAGNINDLELATRQALHAETRLRRMRAGLEIREHREELNKLMGLWGGDTGWRVAGRLPDLPAADPAFDGLERRGVEQRPDLAAARRKTEAAAALLGSARRWRWIGRTEAGGEVERDTDGQVTAGPHLSIEIPLFDQKQAEIARLEALHRKRYREAEEMAIAARAEIRSARDRMVGAREIALHYQRELVPLRKRIVSETQKHYNFMLMGVYELLEAKRDELEAYEAYIDAVKDYWLARADLELAVGGRLEGGAPNTEAHSHHGDHR